MTRYETIEAPGAQPASPGFVPRDDEEELPRLLLRPCFPVDGEILLIAGFDAFDRLLCLERAESDRAGRCIVPPPVWRAALDAKPAQIVMAHNHPSGLARPSDADLATTRESAALPGAARYHPVGPYDLYRRWTFQLLACRIALGAAIMATMPIGA